MGRRKKSRRRTYYDYDDDGGGSGWGEYMPVAQRRAAAKQKIDALRASGEDIQPIEVGSGRLLARKFWGKQWCTHLESFSDYINRLPRGRSYLRNGSVCHLKIESGRVDALVAGSELYEVWVKIEPLPEEKWQALKQRCAGSIGSVIELLQGKLSDAVMAAVVDEDDGLFPLPGEITYSCNCPDYADICKHLAAVMYGIGVRLDDHPEWLFLLRGVNHEELIAVKSMVDAISGNPSTRRSRRRSLASGDLSATFGVELEGPAAQETFEPSAASIAALRDRLQMDQAAFAQAVGVSLATVGKWEASEGPLRLQARSLAGLTRLYQQA